ncbi:sensor histidine kinase [Pseudolysinimonas sp.]|uniref:sensor histidine kinase n=1 Tax=Pseudolysinimonas sp. TaxID=2680009 RepID=UPI003F7D1CB8
MTTPGDAARIQAIAAYRLLEAPAVDLNGLVELAAGTCGVSKAVINIIDERAQHQVAALGFDAAVCAREDSMCAVVMQGGRSVVVADARADPRFAANPFVTGVIGDVRFYASSPLVTPDGITIGTLCVFDENVLELTPAQARALDLLARQVVDVLELRRISRELANSNERLTLFAAQVSHDLRNPLSALIGFLDLALDSGELDPASTAAKALARADGAAERMNDLVTDLLAYAKAGSAPRREEVDLASIVDAVRDDLDSAISAARARVDAAADVRLVGDPMMLRMLVQNLVANAIKFGSAAGREPHVVVAARESGDGWQITVDDDGPGIPVDARERVFEVMERAAGDDVPGLGIGLATCRRVVDAHGGRIAIEDSPLGGARIAVSLPRDPAAPMVPRSPAASV